MSSVLYRNQAHVYPEAVRAEGVYLYDADGRRYLDASGGAAVSSVGHGHPDVIKAICEQARNMAFAHTAFFTNEPQERLADFLAGRFPEDDAKVYFVAGGSEANETAIKLARQYWVARGIESKHIVISREQSYHGNTLGALSVSSNAARRGVFEPLLTDAPRALPCHAYRYMESNETAADYAARVADSVEAAILKAGPENVSAFIAETFVGATLGAAPPVADYLARVRAICDRHDVLLILDEVMCGNGRTGYWYAFETEHVVPDIVTTAKGLAGGYQPLGAVVMRGELTESIAEQHGSFNHGHTYVGHATACAAGVAVTRIIGTDAMMEHVRATGSLIRDSLTDRLGDHPHFGDLRGRGLFWGLELVEDRESRRPFGPERNLAAALKQNAMNEGLIIYPAGGCADGKSGVHILLAPPYTYNEAHVGELCDKLTRAIDVSLA